MAITLVDQLSINDNSQPLTGSYTAGAGVNRLVVVLSPASAVIEVSARG